MKSRKIWIITIFPEYLKPLKEFGVVGRYFTQNSCEMNVINLRDWSDNNYKSVDDYPFGGGAGMIIRPDVLKRALEEGVVKAGTYGQSLLDGLSKLWVVFTSPRGKVWNQNFAKKLSEVWVGCENSESENDSSRDLVFICGRYEGIDQRFIDLYVNQEISLGDYILSGGEIAVMGIIDSMIRLLPGVLGNNDSLLTESFENGFLEAPQYTRPRIFDGIEVPEILLSGHHKKMEEFNHAESLRITKKFRPDLLKK